jgi:hypothetical protein
MPRIVELGLNRIFRSRWGVALVIGIIVVAIVGVGRLFSDGRSNRPSLATASPAPALSVNPSDDDSIVRSEPPPTPKTSPGRAEPEAVAYAFASVWVDHQDVSPKAWRDHLLPNSTKDLADELSGVDPSTVPAERLIGRPSLEPVSDTVVNAIVTMDSGQLTLRLIAPGGHWLVDDIDWAPA